MLQLLVDSYSRPTPPAQITLKRDKDWQFRTRASQLATRYLKHFKKNRTSNSVHFVVIVTGRTHFVVALWTKDTNPLLRTWLIFGHATDARLPMMWRWTKQCLVKCVANQENGSRQNLHGVIFLFFAVTFCLREKRKRNTKRNRGKNGLNQKIGEVKIVIASRRIRIGGDCANPTTSIGSRSSPKNVSKRCNFCKKVLTN